MVNKKVLLVTEDDPSLMGVLRNALEDNGFAILEANNGKDCLKVATAEHPDLILLDILMPQMDGVTVMKELRKVDEWGKGVPIILLTNVSPDDDKINSAIAENTPAYYLVKSNTAISEIVEKIKERLSVKPA